MKDASAPDPGTASVGTASGGSASVGSASVGTASGSDPTEVSRWRPVFRLLSDMDDEIARVYADNGIEDLKPSWVLEIVRLHVRGPMTIADLARSVGRTHSALSQKVAAMRAAGWLETTPGRDARSKKVTLTPKAERVAGLLATEWRATETAITELEAELPYPLTRVAEDIRSALSRKTFHARITEKLSADPAWTSA
jgi:DNA-binding MarR family transcriptional regulator